MASSMEQVPTDVFACIVEHLCMGDLCALSRVTKAYHALVQPLLWTVIEMHASDFHVKTTHKELRAEEAAERKLPPYNTGPPDKERYYTDYKADSRGEEFLKTFSDDQTFKKELREGRKEELVALVQWLCLPTKTKAPSTLSHAFAHFVNLQHLEISMFWERNPGMDVLQAPLPGLRRLRTLKLRGYLPKEFVRWLLSEPDQIEELQLAILDRPVGSPNFGEKWWNPPPPENRRPESMEDMTEEERAKVLEHEDLTDGEWIAARALACLTPEIMSRLVSLKKLYLCKPHSGSKTDEDILYFSTPSDERILQEWNALLKATGKTLQHLTLDQRPVAQENCGDGTSNRGYMLECVNGPSYTRFVEMVLPALIESKSYPNLEVIRLFGFEAHEEGLDEWYKIGYPDCSVDVPGQLRAAFPKAEVFDYPGRRLISWDETGELMPGKSISRFGVHARHMTPPR
jgi:hypothetical protein